jgi:hypothetical protein
VDVYDVDTVWESPELISSLAAYAADRQESGADSQKVMEPRIQTEANGPRSRQARQASILFLRVLAAADYYTDNATLMSNTPPVLIDIILDPFLLNVLPESLMATGAYIVLVAIASWFVSQKAASWIQTISRTDTDAARKKV